LSDNVAFVGFSAPELKKVIVTRYKPNTNFSELMKADTIDASGGFRTSDTAYLASYGYNSYSGFFNIDAGFDYLVAVPSTGDEFRITNVVDGPEREAWQSPQPCSPGSTQASITHHSMQVSGGSYGFGMPSANNYFLYLHR
jgi:hypothetical protein